LVAATAAAVFGFVAWVTHLKGFTLYYGDAEAHLNIARSLVDSRTPGPDQIGTVWLPIPHVLMLPMAAVDWMWRSGVAGSIASAACMAAAAVFLFCATVLVSGSRPAAWLAAGLFALNPNVLYLGSIPMSEAPAMVGFFGLLLATVQFGRTGSWSAVAAAALFSNWLSLTRYEGWFLIPFVAAYLFVAGGRRRWAAALVFLAVGAAGPLAWLAHNWWYTGNALDFYNGPYSAKAIQGDHYYPGRGEWGKAWLYYRTAVVVFAGWGAVWIGLAGAACGLVRRYWWPLFLCALLPAFYLLSMHGSSTPIRVPVLWPGDWYNSRYAISAMPLLAFGGGLLASARWRPAVAVAALAVAIVPWAARKYPENAICWKESQVNSIARRAWTAEAAAFMRAYRPGDGVIIAFGDPIGILREAGIPIREALHEGNGAAWMLATARPDVLLHEKWAVAVGADAVAKAVAGAGGRYDLGKTVAVQGAPPVRIYRMKNESPIH
jgi:hypothetical protein